MRSCHSLRSFIYIHKQAVSLRTFHVLMNIYLRPEGEKFYFITSAIRMAEVIKFYFNCVEINKTFVKNFLRSSIKVIDDLRKFFTSCVPKLLMSQASLRHKKFWSKIIFLRTSPKKDNFTHMNTQYQAVTISTH